MTLGIKKCTAVLRLATFGFAGLSALYAGPAAAAPVEKLQEFSLDQVQITDTYQTEPVQQGRDVPHHDAGLRSPAGRLQGGVSTGTDSDQPLRRLGELEHSRASLGHWLSAVAHAYQQAKGSDPTLAESDQDEARRRDLEAEVLSAVERLSVRDARLPVRRHGQRRHGSNWVPYYTMHKIFAGLIDVYEFEQNADALAVASKLGDWLYARAIGLER